MTKYQTILDECIMDLANVLANSRKVRPHNIKADDISPSDYSRAKFLFEKSGILEKITELSKQAGIKGVYDIVQESEQESVKSIDQFVGEYGFLSNFHYSPIKIDGKAYHTSEHAYQSFKTDDPIWKYAIRTAQTPAGAKKLGGKCPKIENWDRIKIAAMKKVLEAKFCNVHLANKLVETGSVELIEGNTWNDTFWGVCNGEGENNLGKLLMEIRSELRKRKS